MLSALAAAFIVASGVLSIAYVSTGPQTGGAPGAVSADDVLDFWFAPGRERDWFAADPAFDREVRARFGGAVDAALAGELDAWADTPPGALALVVVLDQMTRNAHRGTARAYAGDAAALRLARALVPEHVDMSGDERLFATLPFEHSEDPADQDDSVRMFALLVEDAGPDFQRAFAYAVDHRDVVARFGRFPKRNAALGRASTPAEVAYIRDSDAPF